MPFALQLSCFSTGIGKGTDTSCQGESSSCRHLAYGFDMGLKMAAAEHDTLALRLAEILLRLNQDESIGRQELADQFGVSERTIYRDLNRLAGVVERLADGRYQLVPEYRGRLRPKDLEAFAKLTGVNQLFPNSGQRFLLALLDTLSQSSFLIKGHHYETLKPQDAQFHQLDAAIRQHHRCCLTYADKRRTLEPYRLVNNKGIWYLAATEDQRLKAFSLSRISHLHATDESFVPRLDVQQEIEAEDDVWFSQDKTEVLLTIAPQAAYYFQRRKLLPRQEIVKDLENGGLIVSSRISHANQILSIVRYWIPYARILEPAWLQDAMEKELRSYLQ
jgi:predicted DNA-binding transcriptional regulator YafY